MDELDDLATYNGDTEHDMWVDFTTYENTGELREIFNDSDDEDYPKEDDSSENLDDYY